MGALADRVESLTLDESPQSQVAFTAGCCGFEPAGKSTLHSGCFSHKSLSLQVFMISRRGIGQPYNIRYSCRRFQTDLTIQHKYLSRLAVRRSIVGARKREESPSDPSPCSVLPKNCVICLVFDALPEDHTRSCEDQSSRCVGPSASVESRLAVVVAPISGRSNHEEYSTSSLRIPSARMTCGLTRVS